MPPPAGEDLSFSTQAATDEAAQSLGSTVQEPEADGAGGNSLEDDLDEADFFMSQGLFEEAREILGVLQARYPNHPLVVAKFEELTELEAGQAPSAGDSVIAEPVNLHEVDTATKSGRAPSVVLENPLDDEDADTHYDLGLAYKEMGLYGEAVQAFEKVMSVAGREVQCNLMIGLCHREQGALSEAINQFKAGLYSSDISVGEKFGLYYEIGVTYEALNDPREALYYYEMVLKKEPDYRDIAARVAGIRGGGGKTSEAG